MSKQEPTKCQCEFCTRTYPALRWLKEYAPPEHYAAISDAIEAKCVKELDEAFDKDLISDGFGSVWHATCTTCGGRLEVVRPGKVQCPKCG